MQNQQNLTVVQYGVSYMEYPGNIMYNSINYLTKNHLYWSLSGGILGSIAGVGLEGNMFDALKYAAAGSAIGGGLEYSGDIIFKGVSYLTENHLYWSLTGGIIGSVAGVGLEGNMFDVLKYAAAGSAIGRGLEYSGDIIFKGLSYVNENNLFDVSKYFSAGSVMLYGALMGGFAGEIASIPGINAAAIGIGVAILIDDTAFSNNSTFKERCIQHQKLSAVIVKIPVVLVSSAGINTYFNNDDLLVFAFGGTAALLTFGLNKILQLEFNDIENAKNYLIAGFQENAPYFVSYFITKSAFNLLRPDIELDVPDKNLFIIGVFNFCHSIKKNFPADTIGVIYDFIDAEEIADKYSHSSNLYMLEAVSIGVSILAGLAVQNIMNDAY